MLEIQLLWTVSIRLIHHLFTFSRLHRLKIRTANCLANRLIIFQSFRNEDAFLCGILFFTEF